MRPDDLLAELLASFPPEPRPAESQLVTSNEPGYDWESLQIRDELPEAVMRREQGGFNFLSNRGYHYYLPAYLSFVVRQYTASESIPDRLVQVLTLPAEIDELRAALATRLGGLLEQLPTLDWSAYHLRRLSEADEWVHYFIDRYQAFTPA
jgi:hypothetical protein